LEKRWGDPMLNYIAKKGKKKKKNKKNLIDDNDYKGPFPPNRFNIRPGKEWDGVDRSNRFEQNYFKKQNELKSKESLLYKMNSEDM